MLGRLPLPLRIGLPLAVIALVALTIYLLGGEETQEPEFAASGDSSFSMATGSGTGPLDGGPPEKGKPAPDFRLLDSNGKAVRLSDLRGKPVVLNFWATWCGPCKSEMPELEAAYLAGKGDLVVLAVNAEGVATDIARKEAEKFRDEFDLTFPFVYDSPTTDVFNQYRLKGLPASFFVDREGVIRDIVIGPLTRDNLERRLRPLIEPQ